MTIEEIFKEMSSHMIQGVMFHTQMADYYDFLNLLWYRRCHEHHALREMKAYRKLHGYYANHANRLINDGNADNPNVIPASWYNHVRQDVDAKTKQNAIRTGMEKWVAWETGTKSLYNRMYHEAVRIGESAAAQKIGCFVKDVDNELKEAQGEQLNLIAVDFSMDYILDKQEF